MMVWFCKGTDEVGKFLETAGKCGIDAKIMVLEDDAFYQKGDSHFMNILFPGKIRKSMRKENYPASY